MLIESFYLYAVMRIGKKAKELESKSQVIDGINRMVCTTKSQNVTLTGKRNIS